MNKKWEFAEVCAVLLLIFAGLGACSYVADNSQKHGYEIGYEEGYEEGYKAALKEYDIK